MIQAQSGGSGGGGRGERIPPPDQWAVPIWNILPAASNPPQPRSFSFICCCASLAEPEVNLLSLKGDLPSWSPARSRCRCAIITAVWQWRALNPVCFPCLTSAFVFRNLVAFHGLQLKIKRELHSPCSELSSNCFQEQQFKLQYGGKCPYSFRWAPGRTQTSSPGLCVKRKRSPTRLHTDFLFTAVCTSRSRPQWWRSPAQWRPPAAPPCRPSTILRPQPPRRPNQTGRTLRSRPRFRFPTMLMTWITGSAAVWLQSEPVSSS